MRSRCWRYVIEAYYEYTTDEAFSQTVAQS